MWMWIFLCTGVRGTLGSGLQSLDKSSLTQNKDTQALPLSESCWSFKRLWTEVAIQRERLSWKKAKLKLVAFACTFAEELWDGAVIPSSHCHCSFVSLTFPAFEIECFQCSLALWGSCTRQGAILVSHGQNFREDSKSCWNWKTKIFQMVGLWGAGQWGDDSCTHPSETALAGSRENLYRGVAAHLL